MYCDRSKQSSGSEGLLTRVRCITEMGTGVGVHGKDATKAAKRAVSDAIPPLEPQLRSPVGQDRA